MSYREKTPQIVTILTRRLKPGKTFEDFQQAHLPPGEAVKTEFGFDVDYFPIPTRVINMISLTDPSVIVSIGFSYGTGEAIFKAVQEKMPIEAKRAEKIAVVSDKEGPTQIFAVAADNNYGSRHSDCKQEALVSVTPELVAAIQSFFAPKTQIESSEQLEAQVRRFIKATEQADFKTVAACFAPDVVNFVTNASGGVDRLQGSDAYIDRLRKMDIPRVKPKITVSQITTTQPGQVMVMIDVQAANKGKTLHNHAAFLIDFKGSLICKMRMVEALPSYSDAFWKG